MLANFYGQGTCRNVYTVRMTYPTTVYKLVCSFTPISFTSYLTIMSTNDLPTFCHLNIGYCSLSSWPYNPLFTHVDNTSRFCSKYIFKYLLNIQSDLPSNLTPIISFNTEFIQVLIFGICKYIHLKHIFQMTTPLFTLNYLMDTFFEHFDVPTKFKILTSRYLVSQLLKCLY